MTVVIDSRDALGAVEVPLLGTFDDARIPSVRIPGLSAAENADIESRARTLGRACGCTEGAIASMLALAVYVLGRWLAPPTPPASLARDALLGAAIVVGAAVIAKTITIAVARVRLRRLLRETVEASSLNRESP